MASAATVSADHNRRLALLMGGAMLAGALLLQIRIVTAFSAFAVPASPASTPPAGAWQAEDVADGSVINGGVIARFAAI